VVPRKRVVVYVEREDGLLVFDHRDHPEAGTQVPAGGVDAGEGPSEAAIREVREETRLSDLDFAWGVDHIETEPYAGGKVVRFYVARSAGGAVSLPINPALGRAEHHEFRWLPFEAALALTVPRLQRVLQWAADRVGVAVATPGP